MNATPRMIDAVSFPEVRVVRFRECSVPSMGDLTCDKPDQITSYWNDHVPLSPWWIEDREHFVAFHMNVRRRIIGMNLVSIGTLDTILAHPREVFRAAIVNSAHAIVLAHNHPSGNPTPSEADIKVTRDMVRGGQILKIDVLDHVIIGRPSPDCAKGWFSLREAGYLYAS